MNDRRIALLKSAEINTRYLEFAKKCRAEINFDAKKRVRYCCACGTIGEVPEGARDCCPDGNMAERVRIEIAQQAHESFMAY